MHVNDGKNIEVLSLGRATVTWSGNYVPYQRSMELVKGCQPGDPSDPECPFANDLHALIALELGLEDWSSLQFFTAVESPLDIFHGIDGFFEFNGKVVTIDGTIDPEKVVARADFVVNFGWNRNKLEIWAGQIAQKLS